MGTSSRCSLVLIFTISEILVLGLTTPVWNPQSSLGLGRNIRHLPCVSRRSGETGVCMFAISCAKANGTHLGTCIDRFYFGSCCKLALTEDLSESIDSNHIYEEAPVPASPSTEHYHLSTFQSVQAAQNATATTITSSTTTTTTTTTLRPAITSTTPRTTSETATKRPTPTPTPAFTHKPVTPGKPSVTKPYTQSSTGRPKPTGKPPSRPQGSKPPSVPKPQNSTSSSKPPTKPAVKPPTKPSVKPPTKPAKPSNGTVSKPVLQKPSNSTSSKPGKPSPTKRPSGSGTAKPSLAQQQKPPLATAKPPAKPTQRPSVKPTSGKPVSSSKPPLKPVPLVTTPSTDPDYVKVPVVTVPSASNHSAAGPTTSSTLLVTWTTVDEVPLPPLPQPGSTPSPPTNVTERSTAAPPTTTASPTIASTTSSTTTSTTTSTTQSSQTWVEVSVSTPGPTTEHGAAGPTSESSLSTITQMTVAAAASASTTVSGPANLTTATPTEGSNTTEDASQNEIQHLNMTNYLDVCGRRLFPGARIVGGDKATFGKWPWQISLRQWRTSTYLHKCGAALLNENWAITAAHCVENVAPSDLLLRLGEHDLSLEDEPYGYQERRVQIVASHPQFDPRTFEYDLALLRFYEPVTFQPNIIPVCVPQDDTNFVGSTAYVTGWGRLYEDGPLPSVLQEVSVPVINNSVCETMYRAAGYIEHIPEIFICAGWKKGGFDSCEGDSGGPMVIQRPDKRWLLAGVISWGIGCAEPNQPGVYTRISEFRGWINQILQF